MFPPSDAEEDTIVVPADSTFDARRYGTSNDEQLLGTSGNDVIRGYQGVDDIFAQDGDDWLLGGSGNDFLDGGTGNDMLHAGAGDDRYVFRPGYGEETIDNTGGGVDWLLFTDTLTQDMLIFTQAGDDLVISIKDTTDMVTVKNWFLGSEYQIDYIMPAGGNGIPAAQIAALLTTDPGSAFDTVVDGTAEGEQLVGTAGTNQLNGLGGIDQLFGLAGNDELNGGAGNDYLDGGAGDDVQNGGADDDQLGGDAGDDIMAAGAGDDKYVYRPGSGADTIINSGGGTDWLLFTDDITTDRLSYWKSGDNLLVKIDNSNDTMVTIKDWFLGGENEVAYIQPSGAYGISAAQINTMVQDEPAPAAAPMASSSSMLGDMAASLASGDDYATYGQNAGMYLGSSSDQGISDDLSSLTSNQDSVNKELLAA